MATNDIYNSEGRYFAFKENLLHLTEPPSEQDKRHNRCYYCKNPENLEYFKKIFAKWEAQDLSYVRRNRLLQTLKVVVHNTTKNLKDLSREDIDAVIAQINKIMSPKTVSDFKVDLKNMWKKILPEFDEKGRPDETIIPYAVRHLKSNIDASKQVARKDRLSFEEFDKLIQYFAKKPCIQLYLMIALESLGRPQELLWRKIKDVELFDNYAKINLTDHGKEGVGVLQCIDSYSFLTNWLNLHPTKKDSDSFIFINEIGDQYKPATINKQLRIACNFLNIDKPITCYSLKRNGVTYRRLKGDTDLQIQRIARWTSTDQLKHYDLTDQEDAFKIELIKRGLVDAKLPEHKKYEPETRSCLYCQTINKFTNITCFKCNRPLDRKKVSELEQEKNKEVENRLQNIEQAFTQLAQQLQSPTTINWQGQQAVASNSGLSVGQQFTPFNNLVQCQNCKQFHQATEQHACVGNSNR